MRVRPALAAALLAAGVVALGPSPAHGARAPQPLALVIVAGQSNALGYQSFVTDPVTHDDVFTDRSKSPADTSVLFMWTESGVPSSGATPVRLDAPQVLAGVSSPIFGPEVGLARSLWGQGHRNLLVVKVAFSGSSLATDWQPGDADYTALVTRVQQAEAWARSNGYAPSIVALCWMQGESDAMLASQATTYGSHLKSFLAGLHRDLSIGARVPVVLGVIDLTDYINFEIGHHECTTPSCSGEKGWNVDVMQAQEHAASRYVFVTKTSTLPRYQDFLHLTDRAELSLGRSFGLLAGHHLA